MTASPHDGPFPLPVWQEKSSKGGAEPVSPDRSTTGIGNKRYHGDILGPAGRSPWRTQPIAADRRMRTIDGRRLEQARGAPVSVSSPPAVRRTPPPVTDRRHEDRAMTLRSEHHIRHGRPSGPVPGRTGVPSPAGPADPGPWRGNSAQPVRPAPGPVPSGAIPVNELPAPPPVPWAGAPPRGHQHHARSQLLRGDRHGPGRWPIER